MNIHHLELFYYVARSGGISRAVRQIPYGIQQPAVSGQILLLERDLGAKLFERTPFRLTPAGQELYSYVSPFFEGLDRLSAKLRVRAAPLLRIGAAELILREHLPEMIRNLKRKHPAFRLSLRSGMQAELELALQNREIDLAIIPLEARPAPRLHCRRLVRIPLVLFVDRKSKFRSAEEILRRDSMDEPLICLPASESLTRIFQRELKRRKIDWLTAIEASSLDVVREYVKGGFGVGLGADASIPSKNSKVRALPLEDFPPLEIAALWHAKDDPLVDMILEEVERFIGRLWPDRRVPALAKAPLRRENR